MKALTINIGDVPVTLCSTISLTLPATLQRHHTGRESTAKGSFGPDRRSKKPRETETSEVACQVTVQAKEGKPKSAILEKPSPRMTQHIKPLYVKAHLNGRPLNRVLVDNGSAINILPARALWSLGKTVEDLIATEVTVIAFNGEPSKVLGLLPVELTVGSKTSVTAFFVVSSTAHYQALLGRDWIHANECIPSSLHQFLIMWNGDDLAHRLGGNERIRLVLRVDTMERELYIRYVLRPYQLNHMSTE